MTRATKKRVRGAAKVDAYQVVTDAICEALEAGFVPWHKPWKDLAGGGPRSLSSNRPYSGVNVWVLVATSFSKGYSSPWWGTYEKLRECGGQVRKGEKATTVVFWRMFEKKNPATGEVIERIPLLRNFKIFNADQCDGEIKTPALPESDLADHEPIDVCETMTARYLALGGPGLNPGGNRACYSPALDTVAMPLIGQFESAEAYHATLFHELIHSTGHDSRLKRGLGEARAFGDEDYSKEELVAEMGAAFVCGAAGIDVRVPEHAAYIGSWLRKLRDDNKMLVQAAGAAQRAADLIVGKPEGESDHDEEKED